MSFLRSNIVGILLILACGFMISCRKVIENSSQNVIKMNDAVTQTLYMSDYFESIEYISLETREECLIGFNPIVYVMDDFIVVFSLREEKCFVFDRLSGMFIKKIGNKGIGPNDYLEIPYGLIVNEQEKTICFDKGDCIIEYAITDGKVIHHSTQIQILANKLVYITKDIWAAGLLNTTGNNPNQIVFFDRNEIIDSIPNNNFFTPKNSRLVSVLLDEVFFYRYNHNIYYKHIFNDTIFKIVDRKLQPEWVFEMNKSLQKLIVLRNDPDELHKEGVNYHIIVPIFETDRYLLFNSSYQRQKHAFIFDKHRKQLTEVEKGNFMNDIDGGLNFWMNSTNQNQDLICVYQADFFKEEIDKIDLSEQKAKNPLASQKLRTLLAQLDEEDNPIIVIAKLKK